jgi:hypothetical protein
MPKLATTTGANTARAHSAAERARSSAAGTHGDRRTKRLRDRGARKRAAVREQQG